MSALPGEYVHDLMMNSPSKSDGIELLRNVCWTFRKAFDENAR